MAGVKVAPGENEPQLTDQDKDRFLIMIHDVADEMTEALFTADRVSSIRNELIGMEKYYPAQSHEDLNGQIRAAIFSLPIGDQSAVDSIFLHTLCIASMIDLARQVAE